MRAHRAREADDLDGPLAFHRQADEETGDVRGRETSLTTGPAEAGRYIPGDPQARLKGLL
ncbi:MAG: hypothetical protein DMF96_30790 [Acidobacteria bacterium]|nr:MAG: hypothetical protein DMF96_30790 [Acidobacteriota bacterium]